MVDDLKARLRNWSNGPDDEPPIRLMQAAADRIEKLEAALELWLAYDDQDEADFAQAGPMLLYAQAIDATRATLSDSR